MSSSHSKRKSFPAFSWRWGQVVVLQVLLQGLKGWAQEESKCSLFPKISLNVKGSRNGHYQGGLALEVFYPIRVMGALFQKKQDFLSPCPLLGSPRASCGSCWLPDKHLIGIAKPSGPQVLNQCPCGLEVAALVWFLLLRRHFKCSYDWEYLVSLSKHLDSL